MYDLQIPGFLLEPFLFSTLAYFIIGLRTGIRYYLEVLLTVFVTANTASACGTYFMILKHHLP
jgi:hypothetical protein